jgi:CDP-4-dehydro-6-deoxyglucose reductase
MANFYRSKVLDNQQLNYKFRLVRFRLEDGQSFNFDPGQFIVMKVADLTFRSYSVSSSPEELPEWEIIVDITPGGPGSQFIQNLKPGEIVETTNPRGLFVLQKDENSCFVMGATGCGIASIKPMMEELLKDNQKKIHFFWGLRYEKDLFFTDLLESWKKHSNFDYQIILSQPEGEWVGKTGHITEHLITFLSNCPKDQTSVYLCGSKEMIADVTKDAADIAFPDDKIYFERYS